MTNAFNEADQFLMGGGVKSAFSKDDPAGTRRGGRITDQPEVKNQTDFETGEVLTWDDGSPRKQLVVTVQTDQRDDAEDDGLRRFYVKGNLQKVVRDAVRAAKARGLEVGGELYVTRTGRDEPKRRGMDGAWLHSAEYVPASTGFLNEGTSPAAPAAQAAQPAQQAPASNGDAGMDPTLAAALANLSPEERAALLGANK